MSVLMRYALSVPKKEIYYISWTVDAYEGLGFTRTDDASEGMLSLLFPSGYLSEVESLLCALEAEGIGIERIGITEEGREDQS